MRLRGRLTLVALATGVGALLWALLAAGSEPDPPTTVAAGSPDTPSVAAAAPADTSGAAASLPRDLLGRLPVSADRYAAFEDSPPGTRLVERIAQGPARGFEITYTLDGALGHSIFQELERSRVELGHVVVIDPRSGELLAYASSSPDRFPPTAPYPAASIIKVITAAAALDRETRAGALHQCRTVGNRYRLTRSRLEATPNGRPVSLQRALALSDNQCFAQLAVHSVGRRRLLDAIDRFGFLSAPAPRHAAGVADDPGDDALALGRLGCGLDGCRITPLHAARLAAVLVDGALVTPRWIAGVRDTQGREVALPAPAPPGRAMSAAHAGKLRGMLVATTKRGTARKAFRTRRGPLLQGIEVAGKTGSLFGKNPKGRYEWFIGAVPADEPRIAIAVLVVHGDRWWVTPAQVAAEVLKTLFCPRGVCRRAALDRWLDPPVVEDAAISRPDEPPSDASPAA